MQLLVDSVNECGTDTGQIGIGWDFPPNYENVHKSKFVCFLIFLHSKTEFTQTGTCGKKLDPNALIYPTCTYMYIYIVGFYIWNGGKFRIAAF